MQSNKNFIKIYNRNKNKKKLVAIYKKKNKLNHKCMKLQLKRNNNC